MTCPKENNNWLGSPKKIGISWDFQSKILNILKIKEVPIMLDQHWRFYFPNQIKHSHLMLYDIYPSLVWTSLSAVTGASAKFRDTRLKIIKTFTMQWCTARWYLFSWDPIVLLMTIWIRKVSNNWSSWSYTPLCVDKIRLFVWSQLPKNFLALWNCPSKERISQQLTEVEWLGFPWHRRLSWESLMPKKLEISPEALPVSRELAEVL